MGKSTPGMILFIPEFGGDARGAATVDQHRTQSDISENEVDECIEIQK